MNVLVTGSQGFIGSYLCNELLNCGYFVIGIDNYSKYSKIKRPHDNHKNFRLYEFDLADAAVAGPSLYGIMRTCEIDYLIAGAAMIGGIQYFHKYAYDLLATNERIMANTFDAAINSFKDKQLKKIIVMSSSMVYECTWKFPSCEDDLQLLPPPMSTYGFQKLATEYFCKGAWEQYSLPYNIVRPFNCVGVGEDEAINNENLTLSHVLPDFVLKALRKQKPFEILGDGKQVRCFTNGKDIARGIRLVMESEYSNEDFNISTTEACSIKDLAHKVWNKINDNEIEFKYLKPYNNDVSVRLPDVNKAARKLGFYADICLDESINEVIEYVRCKSSNA